MKRPSILVTLAVVLACGVAVIDLGLLMEVDHHLRRAIAVRSEPRAVAARVWTPRSIPIIPSSEAASPVSVPHGSEAAALIERINRDIADDVIDGIRVTYRVTLVGEGKDFIDARMTMIIASATAGRAIIGDGLARFRKRGNALLAPDRLRMDSAYNTGGIFLDAKADIITVKDDPFWIGPLRTR